MTASGREKINFAGGKALWVEIQPACSWKAEPSPVKQGRYLTLAP